MYVRKLRMETADDARRLLMCSPILLTTANYATAMTLNLPACILHLHTTSILYTSTIESYPRCLACIRLSCLRLSFPAACPPKMGGNHICENHTESRGHSIRTNAIVWSHRPDRHPDNPSACRLQLPCAAPKVRRGQRHRTRSDLVHLLADLSSLAMLGYAWLCLGS